MNLGDMLNDVAIAEGFSTLPLFLDDWLSQGKTKADLKRWLERSYGIYYTIEYVIEICNRFHPNNKRKKKKYSREADEKKWISRAKANGYPDSITAIKGMVKQGIPIKRIASLMGVGMNAFCSWRKLHIPDREWRMLFHTGRKNKKNPEVQPTTNPQEQ
jgi:hypothetical protein